MDAIFTKGSFINSSQKNQLMEASLEEIRKANELMSVQASGEPVQDWNRERMRRQISYQTELSQIQSQEPSYTERQKNQDNWNLEQQIAALEKDIEAKRKNREEVETQTSVVLDNLEQRWREGRIRRETAETKAQEIQTRLDELTNRVFQDIQEKERQIAELKNRQDENEVRFGQATEVLYAQIAEKKQELKEAYERSMESLNMQAEQQALASTAWQTLLEVLPAGLLTRAVQALEQYRLRDLMRKHDWQSGYYLQCVIGTMRFVCQEPLMQKMRSVYDPLMTDGFVQLPYVCDREHPVRELFAYREEDTGRAVSHFTQICKAQILLHIRFGYELNVISDWQLLGLPEEDGRFQCNYGSGREALLAKLDELEAWCSRLSREYLKDSFETLADYNRACGTERLPYKGLAISHLTAIADAPVLRRICTLYDLAERCGVFFLLMLNQEDVMDNDTETALLDLREKVRFLEYRPEQQGYLEEETGFWYHFEEA